MKKKKIIEKEKTQVHFSLCGCLIEEPAVVGGGGQQSHVLQMTMEMVMMRMVTAMMGMEMVMRMVVMIVTAMMEMMMVSAFGPAIICPYGQPRSPAKWLKLHQESTFIHHLPLSASKPQTRCIWIADQLTGSGTIA